jgi:hypothetical protein
MVAAKLELTAAMATMPFGGGWRQGGAQEGQREAAMLMVATHWHREARNGWNAAHRKFYRPSMAGATMLSA